MAFGWFKKAKENQGPEQSGYSALARTLRSRGLADGDLEINEMLARLMQALELHPCLPEDLLESDSAELEYSASAYRLFVSRSFAGAGGLERAITLATYYAAISELARDKGISDYVLEPGRRIAVCDPKSSAPSPPHPIRSLVPGLDQVSVL